MSEYSIQVLNGKVIGDSAFFFFANESLGKELKRICDFTDTLDVNSEQKKDSIIEYKCAKYRYASVSKIHTFLQTNNFHRKQQNLEYTHYLLLPIDNIFKSQVEYFVLYKTAPSNEKPDYSLYYAMLTVIENDICELREKLHNATDWEKVEVEERIGGFEFAKECLNEAWQNRKDVVL